MQLVEEGAGLVRRAVLKDALEDTAAVRMRRETVDFADAGVGDEEEVFGRDTLERALRIEGGELRLFYSTQQCS